MNDGDFRARVMEERTAFVETVKRRLLSAAPAAAETLTTLMSEASSESVRLAAARETLTFALGRRRRFDELSTEQVTRFLEEVVDAALRRMPPDRHQMFLLEMNAIADRI